jgi:mRNA (guanine-N7-)-methyltransferase
MSEPPEDHHSHATSHSTQSRRRQDDQVPSNNTTSSPSKLSRRSDIDRYPRNDRNDHRNGERDQRRRSREPRRSGDRHTSPPRRSRTRSPVRRRSPKSRIDSAYRRRDPPPPPRRPRSPSPIRRSPPREEQPTRRPGGGSGRGRNVLAIAQRLAEEREREQEGRNAEIQRERGVQQMSNQFYNARPEWVKERGREWRKNESKIKGLRSFNNWIKSCIIQKFSPEEAPQVEELGWGEEPKAPAERKPLLVLDMGCGKGGDLGKWQLAPQTVGLYVGLDPADQSILQARDRYNEMRRRRKPIFDARFHVKDCFGEWIGDIPIVNEVGIDPNAGHGGPSKWSGGGFDVVTMMFSMHYAFETEHKARTMLRNVAGSLKKGGRFIGVVPNSDAIAEQVVKWCKINKDKKLSELGTNAEAIANESSKPKSDTNEEGEETLESTPHWGNSLYNVRFVPDRPTPTDGIFRDPPFGWKYMYWMEEAVDVPEYVVPWEAFRAVAEGYNLEQRYRKPFLDVWEAEKDDRELRGLSVRMGVRKSEGEGLSISKEEREAVRFYHAFCFVKV